MTDTVQSKNQKPIISNNIDSTVIATVISKHLFSENLIKDSFILILKGKTILTGTIDFKIFKNKSLIYEDSFLATDFLYDQADIIPSVKQKEDSIMTRVKHFFAETHFIQPAIDSTEKSDDNNPDPKIWKEIKSYPSAIGFIYSYGYEGTYGIAYLKSKQKAVQYFFSD